MRSIGIALFDLDGDGQSDILWQNDNRQPAAWLMDGIDPLVEATVGPNPGSAWHMNHQNHDLI